MNSLGRLDKISYYLSYTDIVPILNIPSAIVHFICAIRDRSLGVSSQQKYPPIANESLRQVVIRKLDKQSHLQKGILAISGIGCLILIYKCVKKKWEVHQVCKYATNKKDSAFHHLNDKEIFTALLRERKATNADANCFGKYPTSLDLFSALDDGYRGFNVSIRGDKAYILYLIDEGLINAKSWYRSLGKWLKKEDQQDIIIAFIRKEPNKEDLDHFYNEILPLEVLSNEVRNAYEEALTRLSTHA